MNHSYFLDSNIDINSSSYETRKNVIRDLKEFTQTESIAIDQLVTKNPISEILSRRCKLNDDVIKIATIGERAEDVFYLRNEYQDSIPIETINKLESELIESLDY